MGPHPSYDHKCSHFLDKCRQIDSCRPKNNLAFYPTDEAWTWSTLDYNPNSESPLPPTSPWNTPTTSPPTNETPLPLHPPHSHQRAEIPTPIQPSPMNSTTDKKLWIWQQNLNKSLNTQHHLLSTTHPNDWDLILLQEPWLGHTRNTRSSTHWRVLYPSTHFTDNIKPLHSIIFIIANIPTNSHDQIQFSFSDITGI